LQTLGVDPEYQRKGAATLLINAMIAKAAHSGDNLCLETDTEVNVSYYFIKFLLITAGTNID
jgi:GNAT superfamily N-acetyltransferase